MDEIVFVTHNKGKIASANRKLQAEVDKIYFSLGNKESKVKNKALATVQNNTKELEKLFDDKGIKTIYEENEGNHFQNADLRMAKGIKWILE